MSIISVDHITINMRSPEKSFSFYEEVLGLNRDDVVDMGDHVLYLYQLPGLKLELIEYKEPQRQIHAGNTDIGVYRHFALLTDDIDALYRRCLSAGFGINMAPAFVDKLSQTVMLIKDPNGVEIEIIQRESL